MNRGRAIRSLAVWTVLSFGIHLWFSPTLHAADPVADPDEQLLRDAGIETNNAKLLAYLRERSSDDTDLLNMDRLVRQLGDTDFAKREQALSKLVRLGSVAVPSLREASKHPDAEIARRSKDCLQRIAQPSQTNTPLALVRLLLKRQPSGTVQALINYLPYTVDPEVEEEIWYGVDGLVAKDVKTRQEIAHFLRNAIPERRALAGCLLSRIGDAKEKEQARDLLKDSQAIVRLRTAQGLLAGADKAAVPVLIGLLDHSSSLIIWQAEELLRWAAGNPAVYGETVPGVKQRPSRSEWEKWWNCVRDKLDLSKHITELPSPCLYLICERGSNLEASDGRVWLCGSDGSVQWELRGLRSPSEALFLPAGSVAISEMYSGLFTERDFSGKTIWSFQNTEGLAVSWRQLPQGTVLLVGKESDPIRIITREGNSVSNRTIEPNSRPADCLRILPTYHVFYAQLVKSPAQFWSLGEVNPFNGKIVNTMKLPASIINPTEFRPFPNRHVVFIQDSEFIEVDEKGGIVSRKHIAAIPRPVQALLLRNGNSLVVGHGEGVTATLAQVSQSGKLNHEIILDTIPTSVSPCLALVSLGFPVNQTADLDSLQSRIQQLKHPKPQSALRAVHALGRYGLKTEEAIPPLVDAFENDTISSYAITNLVRIGPKTVPYLRTALGDRREKVRAAAVIALGAFAKEADKTLSDLIRTLDDSSPLVRRHATRTIGSFGPQAKQAAPKLIDILKKDQTEISTEAALALGRIGPESVEVIPALVAAMKSNDVSLRSAAISGISLLGPRAKAAVPALIEILKDKRLKASQSAILDALKRIGPEAVEAVSSIVELLKECDLAEEAAETLGWIGTGAKDSIPALFDLLDKSDRVATRLQVIEALGRIGLGNSDVATKLQRFTTDSDPEIKSAAVNALRRIERR